MVVVLNIRSAVQQGQISPKDRVPRRTESPQRQSHPTGGGWGLMIKRAIEPAVRTGPWSDHTEGSWIRGWKLTPARHGACAWTLWMYMGTVCVYRQRAWAAGPLEGYNVTGMCMGTVH
eukprot:359635-Chlamydomonas_euryale.AAC.2